MMGAAVVLQAFFHIQLFSVDDHGAVSDVETASDAIPADVTSCIQAAFNAMPFAPAKPPPAKVVYPIDFNKDS